MSEDDIGILEEVLSLLEQAESVADSEEGEDYMELALTAIEDSSRLANGIRKILEETK